MTEIRFYGWKYPAVRFLSNFFTAPFELDGKTWKSSEHYYQAMKSEKPAIQEMLRLCDKAGAAKEMGGMVENRKDWEAVKEGVMRKALRAKFSSEEMKNLLLSTGDAKLIEASPTDFYWGEGDTGQGQNRLGVLLMELRDELGAEIRDVLHKPAFLTLAEQKLIIQEIRTIDPGFYTPVTKFGSKMNLRMNCLGWHWDAKTYKYEKMRTDQDGKEAPKIPESLKELGCRALRETRYWPAAQIRPFDIIIANFYEESGKLGLHQDNSESKAALDSGYPVVSFSIGASANFLIGGLKRTDPTEEMVLRSGDLLIFGRSKRLAFHGVKSMIPASTPAELGLLKPGRLNLTFRIKDVANAMDDSPGPEANPVHNPDEVRPQAEAPEIPPRPPEAFEY